MSAPTARFLCISDTHFGTKPDYIYRGYSPLNQFQQLLPELLKEEKHCDAVLHLGDLCGDAILHAQMEHYQYATAVLSAFKTPILPVTGNHDLSLGIKSLLGRSQVTWSDQTELKADYFSDINGVRIISIDSSVYTRRAGQLSQSQLLWLNATLQSSPHKALVLIHHPLHQIGCEWIDSTMLLSEPLALRNILELNHSKVLGVLHGHVHDAITRTVGGICYATIPSTIFPFDTTFGAADGGIEPSCAIGYAIAEIIDGSLRISYRIRTAWNNQKP